jgi:hypothetical protein
MIEINRLLCTCLVCLASSVPAVAQCGTPIGNQPPCTNQTACDSGSCVDNDQVCQSNGDCCDENSVCLSTDATMGQKVCGEPRPSGAPCGINSDCETDYCDLGKCEPTSCDCFANACAGGYICSSGYCQPPALGGQSTCSNQYANCIIGASNCTYCIPPICTGGTSWNPQYCSCYVYSSPIIIDTDDSGFHLSSTSSGVNFDFFGTGTPVQIAWTARGSTNGWLALDRNHDGKIDSGRELFGNIAEQPESRVSPRTGSRLALPR